jgi:hypothetical protein
MNSVKTCLLAVCVVVTGAVWAQDAQVVTVQQTDIKRIAGEVVQVRGNLLTLRHDDGSGREAYRIPRGASIRIKGDEIRLQDLQPGQKVRLYYRETSQGRVIVLTPPAPQQEPTVMIDEEAAQVTPLPEETPEQEALPATLPDTAGPLPLLGLLGAVFLGLGATISFARRRMTRDPTA